MVRLGLVFSQIPKYFLENTKRAAESTLMWRTLTYFDFSHQGPNLFLSTIHESMFLTTSPEILSAFFCWFCLFCIGLLMRLLQRQLWQRSLVHLHRSAYPKRSISLSCFLKADFKSFCDALRKYNRLFPLLLGGFNWINNRSCCFHCRARLLSTLSSLLGLNQLKKNVLF